MVMVSGDPGWLREGGGGPGSWPDMTHHIFAHAVVSPGWPGVPKPRKCQLAPKVQAKPSKPPTTAKPGRRPSSLALPSPSGGLFSTFISLLLQSPKALSAAWPRSWPSAQDRLSSPEQVRDLGGQCEGWELHRCATHAATQDLAPKRPAHGLMFLLLLESLPSCTGPRAFCSQSWAGVGEQHGLGIPGAAEA